MFKRQTKQRAVKFDKFSGQLGATADEIFDQVTQTLEDRGGIELNERQCLLSFIWIDAAIVTVIRNSGYEALAERLQNLRTSSFSRKFKLSQPKLNDIYDNYGRDLAKARKNELNPHVLVHYLRTIGYDVDVYLSEHFLEGVQVNSALASILNDMTKNIKAYLEIFRVVE